MHRAGAGVPGAGGSAGRVVLGGGGRRVGDRLPEGGRGAVLRRPGRAGPGGPAAAGRPVVRCWTTTDAALSGAVRWRAALPASAGRGENWWPMGGRGRRRSRRRRGCRRRSCRACSAGTAPPRSNTASHRFEPRAHAASSRRSSPVLSRSAASSRHSAAIRLSAETLARSGGAGRCRGADERPSPRRRRGPVDPRGGRRGPRSGEVPPDRCGVRGRRGGQGRHPDARRPERAPFHRVRSLFSIGFGRCSIVTPALPFQNLPFQNCRSKSGICCGSGLTVHQVAEARQPVTKQKNGRCCRLLWRPSPMIRVGTSRALLAPRQGL